MRRTTAILVCGATAAALALGSLAGGVLAESPAAESSPAASASPSPALADRVLAGAAGGVTAGTVAQLEEAIRARPGASSAGDADLLVQLGFAYQLRWRESADASFLPRSEAALRRALRARPGDANAVLGLGSLALIRHEFRSALAYGQRAKRLLPGSARPFGVIADALVELGRYEAAFAAVERMVTLRPSLASYSRVAYARELTGDRAGAIAAMRLALDAAGGQAEASAWSLVELARLERGRGKVGVAARHVRDALRVLPGYPAARAELAHVEATRGRLERAIAVARRAADAVPTAQAVTLLADLLDRSGRPAEARQQRRIAGAVERLLRANGVRLDLESAVYRADLGSAPEETVALARRARSDRPSVFGDDALAWALARADRCEEALGWSRRALRLGTEDPLLFFHRGYAEGCVGNRSAMRGWYERALDLDPEFSVRWAPVARQTLSVTDS
jgi:tetratricopeptide (TPR) repeat protein